LEDFIIPKHPNRKICTAHIINFGPTSDLHFNTLIQNNKEEFIYTIVSTENPNRIKLLTPQPNVNFYEQCALNIILFSDASRRIYKSQILPMIIHRSKYTRRSHEYSTLIILTHDINDVIYGLSAANYFPAKIFLHQIGVNNPNKAFPIAVLYSFANQSLTFTMDEFMNRSSVMYTSAFPKSITDRYPRRNFYYTRNIDERAKCTRSSFSLKIFKDSDKCSFFDIMSQKLGTIHNVSFQLVDSPYPVEHLNYIEFDYENTIVLDFNINTYLLYFLHKGEVTLTYCQAKEPSKFEISVGNLISPLPLNVCVGIFIVTFVGSLIYSTEWKVKQFKRFVSNIMEFVYEVYAAFVDQCPETRIMSRLLFFIGITCFSNLYKEDMTVGMMIKPLPTPFENAYQLNDHNYTVVSRM